jgi:hypothetical protein
MGRVEGEMLIPIAPARTRSVHRRFGVALYGWDGWMDGCMDTWDYTKMPCLAQSVKAECRLDPL